MEKAQKRPTQSDTKAVGEPPSSRIKRKQEVCKKRLATGDRSIRQSRCEEFARQAPRSGALFRTYTDVRKSERPRMEQRSDNVHFFWATQKKWTNGFKRCGAPFVYCMTPRNTQIPKTKSLRVLLTLGNNRFLIH